jgi:hypothetical protein
MNTRCVRWTSTFHDTPLLIENARLARATESWKTLVIPLKYVLGIVLYFDSGDVSIAGAAEAAGIETVHYADIERESFLRIWTQSWLYVLGE